MNMGVGMISGVNQVVLYVEDQEQAKRFWTEKMGCTVVQDDAYGDERWIAVRTPDGAMRLVLSKREPGHAVGPVRDGLPHSNVFLYTDDVEATHRELVAKGVTFPEPPTKQFFGWWSLFEDQDGTRYALGERWGGDAWPSRTRHDFLTAARSAATLLRDPAVAAAWSRPSALPEFSVGGLAAHLAYQVLAVPDLLAAPEPTEPVVSVLGHYERVPWVEAGLDDEINVRIRETGESSATVGTADLLTRLDAVIHDLAGVLPAAPNRPVRLPFWGDWSLLLDDLLVTRMMEITVHSDDLAVSVGLPTPELPAGVLDPVLDLLVRLSTRRHGQAAVLRALSRAERAGGIAAF